MKTSGVIHKDKNIACPLSRALRFIALSVLLIGIISYINQLLVPKYLYENNSAPMTGGHLGFYDMDGGTVDVLLLGSSHMGTAINPMDMYEAAHIRAYNLAVDGQTMWMSYYWLREALEYQTPTVVVLDCYYLFYDGQYDEAAARKNYDCMKWGRVKLEAVQVECNIDSTQSSLSYLLTNIRYHNRWDELEEYDFTWAMQDVNWQGLGFYNYSGICEDVTFSPISEEDVANAAAAEFNELGEEYLDKITELCDSYGIELILIKTPTHYQTAERHVAIQNYADEHELQFYDFNMQKLYDEIEFDYPKDMNDSSVDGMTNAHANIRGARKMSVWLAEMLQSEFQIESIEDEQWEASLELNEIIWHNFELQNEDSLSEYLTILQKDYDTVFITIKSGAGNCLSEEEINILNSLGFSYSCREGMAWFGVREDGTTMQSEAGYVSCSGTIRDGLVSYSVLMEDSSPGTGNITLGGEVYSQEESGIHIVVYNDEFHYVVDEVCFVLSDDEWSAQRTIEQ